MNDKTMVFHISTSHFGCLRVLMERVRRCHLLRCVPEQTLYQVYRYAKKSLSNIRINGYLSSQNPYSVSHDPLIH